MTQLVHAGSAPAHRSSGARCELADALAACRRAFWGVALFSALINVLYLTGPLFIATCA